MLCLHSLQKLYLDSFISDRIGFTERQLPLESNGELEKVSNKSFDEQLRDKIMEDFNGSNGEELASAYEQTKSKLQQQVYENIRGKEPDLSDHGTKHVSNVQRNAIRLLSDDGIIRVISGIEMYCLGMFILFHDVGNIRGREDHHNNVAEVFDDIRGNEGSVLHEKMLVVKATRAHTGTAQDGSCDTLKEVTEIDHLEGEPVRLRQLAAILRFADELAEGPQRTSEFMRKKNLYRSESRKFHDYASSTNILIDRQKSRIAITYNIKINVDKSDELRNFLSFIFERIQKLNQERQYARYYSEFLAPFKSTEVTFNFQYGSDILDIDLSPLKLTDIVIPGDPTKEIADIDSAYSIDNLVPDLLERCRKVKKT